MGSETTTESRRADARANHIALLEAAVKLASQSSPGLPYEEIALAAGVGRATVYRHFPTRDALARALIEAALDRWDSAVGNLEPGPGRLEALFDTWVREQQDRSRSVDLLARSAPEDDRRRARRRLEATLRDPIQEAHENGTLPPDIAARDVRIVLTMLSAALRSSDSAADRRRAIELSRRMLSLPTRRR